MHNFKSATEKLFWRRFSVSVITYPHKTYMIAAMRSDKILMKKHLLAEQNALQRLTKVSLPFKYTFRASFGANKTTRFLPLTTISALSMICNQNKNKSMGFTAVLCPEGVYILKQ